MEKKFCDNCEKELYRNWIEVSGVEKEEDYGMELNRGKQIFCSLKCVGEFVDKRMRHVVKYTKKESNGVETVEYKNSELGKIDEDDIVEERYYGGLHFVVKPEVWRQRYTADVETLRAEV